MRAMVVGAPGPPARRAQDENPRRAGTTIRPMPTHRNGTVTVGDPAGTAPRVAVVISRYNASVTDRLLEGALKAYESRGGFRIDVAVIDAPGSYELPALALAAARTGRFAGVVAIGCLIKGETSHDRYIAEAVAQGLIQVTIATGLPVAFGVLTVETPAQARARAGGALGNRGEQAMRAVLDTIGQIRMLQARARRSPAPSTRRRLPDKAAARGATGGRGRR